jgi:hypothetical protein
MKFTITITITITITPHFLHLIRLRFVGRSGDGARASHVAPPSLPMRSNGARARG